MASDKVGGYGYNFVKEPPDTTMCVICQLPSRDPYLSVCCGHVFCKSCLDNAKKAAAVTNCPMCRSEDFVVFPNKQADRVVKNLHVYCTNKGKGCKWQGEMNYISDHLGRSDGCDFEDIQCSNKCGEIVQRQYLVIHMEAECLCRMVTCQYCSVDGECRLIEREHKELCPKFPLPCPNKCDVGSVPRQDMTEHRKMCPLEEVECFNECGKKLQRQYLDSHLETKCPRRIVNCQYCQLTGEHQFIEGQHKEQCPKFPLPCPNNCDSKLKVSREDMDTHRKECPLETVQCQYQCVGCDDVMVRKHRREHNKGNMEEHLALAVSELINSRQHLVAVEERLQHDVTSVKIELMQKMKQDLAATQQELATTKLDAQQKINDLKKISAKTEHDLVTVKQGLEMSKFNAAKTEGELQQRLEGDLMNVRQTAAKTVDALKQRLAKTEQDLAATKRELVSVKTAKDQLAQKLTKTENDLATVKKELTTTKRNNSVAHARFLVTEIKYKLPSINEEVTKMFTSLQGNIDSVNQKCQHVADTKRKHVQKVNSVDEYARQFIGELQKIENNSLVEPHQKHLNIATRKQEIPQELLQIVDGIKQNIENKQEQLLQNIIQTEGELHQQLDDIELHIKSINELILQLDTLMKELTIYGENSVIEKLITVNIDTLKSNDEMMKKLTQKRENVTEVKKRLETTKADITTNTRDLLKQLSDKHDQAKQWIEEVELPFYYSWFHALMANSKQ